MITSDGRTISVTQRRRSLSIPPHMVLEGRWMFGNNPCSVSWWTLSQPPPPIDQCSSIQTVVGVRIRGERSTIVSSS
ncbi:hypothetical protein UPYG_G00063360 [Umbra pygmaea]|uniref:Uncharacterized protein n=1 Tax=Umbra pygmaea TaxID=75934 RepID=A0ABD0XA13_UMBPY